MTNAKTSDTHAASPCCCSGCSPSHGHDQQQARLCRQCAASARLFGAIRFRESLYCPDHYDELTTYLIDPDDPPQHVPTNPPPDEIRWILVRDTALGIVARANMWAPDFHSLPKPGDVITTVTPGRQSANHTVAGIRHANHNDNAWFPTALLRPATCTGAAEQPLQWRWRRRNDTWVATGTRPLSQDETPPENGAVITITRRDGSSSRHQALDYVGQNNEGHPQLTVGRRVR